MVGDWGKAMDVLLLCVCGEKQPPKGPNSIRNFRIELKVGSRLQWVLLQPASLCLN